MRVESESPTALARGRAEKAKPNWISQNNKAREKLQARTNDLEAIADWRDELQSRIHRSQLIFEFCDCYHRDETLAAEVEMFKGVCAGLAESCKQPLPERKAA